MSLSSDFIIGFPGETDADFAKLMSVIEEVGYDTSFSFIFSPRPGTPAANLHDDTPHDVKLRRLQRLQATIEENVRASARAWSARSAHPFRGRPGPQGSHRAARPHREQPRGQLRAAPAYRRRGATR